MSSTPQSFEGQAIRIRAPRPPDGPAVHALIDACPPLDTNSLYCNLLQCTHFAGTSALAEQGGSVVGWVSGYRRPDRPDTLFIWQVAIAASARGSGIARRLVLDILARLQCRGVRFISTTITAANTPSWALFESLARTLSANGRRRVLFDRAGHFNGAHETEHEFLIGPFHPAPARHPTSIKNPARSERFADE